MCPKIALESIPDPVNLTTKIDQSQTSQTSFSEGVSRAGKWKLGHPGAGAGCVGPVGRTGSHQTSIYFWQLKSREGMS